MNAKRWWAILIAAVLLLASLGFRFMGSIATTNFEDMFKLDDNQFEEEIIEEGVGDKIAVLELNGIIQDTAPSPVLNTTSYNHKRFLDMLEQAGEDSTVDGIILRVNTPGGGVVESAEIHDKIIEIQEQYEKPIYVSMGNTAASGGYYISAPANKVVAHPATVTGSIGVIMEGYDLSGLAEKWGIDFNTIKSGEYKDILSFSREMTDEEREILQTMVDDMYADFVNVIVDGRGMSESKVRELGDGRVYTGSQAKENGLVDELGSLDDTIAYMAEDNDFDDVQVVKYNYATGFNEWLGMSVQSMFTDEAEFLGIMDMIRQSNAPRAMYLYTN
ncbi:signal peptide peptidase SppA [Virgibacillus dokdonensis]|uniref:Signal peptide peptidase SppA n=1 Tax=Virgibacillus dokdonensis TaxID=302167 RepID=A0A2K9IVY3_9BACI|nr:signal peptide peptidase SppA [Virgibacillus dokdonensis]AUJ23912.1 Putative signal peptide peptidase SppA [Virgibacillus dokdonensis]